MRRELYIVNPGNSKNLILILPKQDFTLSTGTIAIIGETVKDSTLIDTTTSTPAPIPGPWTITLVIISAAMLSLLLYNEKNRQRS